MISKILHVVWFGDYGDLDTLTDELVLKDKHMSAIRSFRSHHADWQIMIWSTLKAYDFIQAHYPHHLKVYRELEHDIQRADFSRYALLHYYGGVYMDLDTVTVGSIDAYANSRLVLTATDFPYSTLFKLLLTPPLTNCFMMSAPQEQFWVDLMNRIEIEVWESKASRRVETFEKYVLKTTGPHALTRQFFGCANVYLIPKNAASKEYPHARVLRDNEVAHDRLGYCTRRTKIVHLGHAAWSDATNVAKNTILNHINALLLLLSAACMSLVTPLSMPWIAVCAVVFILLVRTMHRAVCKVDHSAS